MSPKRILYVVNVDWFFVSHRLSLAVEAKQRGYEVFVATKDTGKRSLIESTGLHYIEVPFERSGKNPITDFFLIFRLWILYLRIQPSIIHHVSIKPVLYGSMAAKLAGYSNRVVNAVSGLGVVFTSGKSSLTQRVVKSMMRIAFSRSQTRFIFQNPDDLNLYKSMGLLSEGKYRIIKGSGVDAHLFRYTPPALHDVLKVVLPARMLSDKGVFEFVEAARILHSQYHGKVLFELVGGCDNGNPAVIPESQLESMLMEDYLIWSGHSERMKQVYIEADIVCLPSYREGLPKSLVEAMAIGRPIVTTDVPGCRECVIDSVNGYIVPAKNAVALANAIQQLLDQPELRLQMGKAGRKMMEDQMSLATVVNQTFEFYNR